MASFICAARSALIPLFLLLASGTSAFAQHTYYISKSTGSDSNSGTSKSSPWAHLPGMTSWTGSYTPSPGDTLVLMGCDAWTNSDLPVLWNWSGSSGSLVTIGGEDQTWYNTTNCPSAWNRPIFDAGKAAIPTRGGITNDFFIGGYSGATAYVTLDNIEMRGLYCSSPSYGQCDFVTSYEGTTNWTISNSYFHGWNITNDPNAACVAISFGGTNTTFTNNIISGSDSTGNTGSSCYAFYPSFAQNLTNNVIHDIANGIVGYVGSGATSNISGNLLYNVNPNTSGAHPNALETVGAGTYYIHDNVIHDINAGGAEVMMLGNTGEADYVWNNVMYNISNANNPTAPQNSGQTGMSLYFWNNTIVSGGGNCVFWGSGFGGSFTAVVIENLHCISPSGTATEDSNWNGTTATLSGNLAMSTTTATSQGYTTSEAYAYSPSASTNSTVGAGTNLTSNCSGSTAGLCNDTSYACWLETVSGVIQVACPARTASVRPSSGAWGTGAYQFSSSQAQTPQPPTNVVATVQ